MRRLLLIAALWTGTAALAVTAQEPARDRPAQPAPVTGTAKVSGRIVTADTGRPIARARVSLFGNGAGTGRVALTGSDGLFEFTDLPAGRYSLNAAKTGYVAISYGQRRPLQAGTPLDLTAGQVLTGLELLLPRGSAIGGHVTDETGDPLPGATVRVARYQYQQGARVLVVAGTAQTDDQGSFRVWGLDPGTYYVSALARIPIVPPISQILDSVPGRGGPPAGLPAGPPPPPGRGGGRGQFVQLLNADDDPRESETYTPTFYPGVPSANDARPVVVSLGGETLGIDFGVLLVRTGRLSGRVTRADGSIATGGNVVLMPEGLARGGGRDTGGRIDGTGNFALANVPPGRYMLQARSNNRDAPESARQPVTIVEGDLVNVVVALAPPGSISGTIRFSGAGAAPDPSQLRVAAPPAEPGVTGSGQVRVQRDGTFTIPAVEAGAHWLRAPAGGQPNWTLVSALVNGRESIDTPIDVRSGQTISGVTLTFSDRVTEISGTLSDGRGTPLTGYTVLAFPTDSTLWRPQARQIMTTRPDQNGKYQLRGLPAGTYYLTAIDPEQQGEWNDPEFLDAHRAGAARLSLAEGDRKTQDFSLAQQR